MKTSFQSAGPRARRPRTAGFSLIEVTLALGIVAFSLVGIIGVLPIAATSSRQSFDQNRAAAIGETVFSSFRSQPFQSVCYLDEQLNADGTAMTSPAVAPIDLDSSTLNSTATTGTPVTCYVTFLDPGTSVSTSDAYGTQRHLLFSRTQSTGADFLVTMYFNNQPDGMAIAPQSPVPAEANRVELVIAAVSNPTNKYRFVSTVANRVH